MEQNTQTPFCWVPGATPDPEALERLRRFFPKPAEPMGEAWFMSAERTMYQFLLDEPLNEISVRALRKVLNEIASGFSCFGEADKMWRPWFFYLLGNLIPRAHESEHFSFLWESLISAFITQFPGDIDPEPYPGFASDIFATLAVSPMNSKFWEDGRIRTPDLAVASEITNEAEMNAFLQQWRWWLFVMLDWSKAEDNYTCLPKCGWLSSMMFFCIKYLPDDSLEPWLRSALLIRDPIWSADLIAWLVGYRRMRVAGSPQPNKFSEIEPDISWDGYISLDGSYDGNHFNPSVVEFISESRYSAFESLLRQDLTKDLVTGWLEEIRDAKRFDARMEKIIAEFLEAFPPAG